MYHAGLRLHWQHQRRWSKEGDRADKESQVSREDYRKSRCQEISHTRRLELQRGKIIVSRAGSVQRGRYSGNFYYIEFSYSFVQLC